MGITGMVTTVTDVLNIWNDMGVFSYVIPFLLIFAIIFAILDKTKILGDNRPIESIVATSIGLLSLQFDFVSEFFAIIFPRFGMGIAIFIVLIIMVGFFFPADSDIGKMKWIGYTVGIGVVLWAITSWDQWYSYNGFGGWFAENIWSIIVLAILVTVVVVVTKKPSPPRAAGS